MSLTLNHLIIIAAVAGGGYFAYTQYVDQAAVGKALDEAMTLDPYKLGKAQMLPGRYDKAIEAYERALEQSPDDERAPQAKRGIGKAYEQLKKPAEAIAAYKRLLKEHPNYKDAAIIRSRLERLDLEK